MRLDLGSARVVPCPRSGNALDTTPGVRETPSVLYPGQSRRQLASQLNAAYADGLLSERTFTARLDQLLRSRVIDPASLVGDLSRRSDRVSESLRGLRKSVRRLAGARQSAGPMLLALDWSGDQEELLVGRDPRCEIVLSHPTVSRRHARLVARDGGWIVQDLESTNGTIVNRVRVGRCRIAPGDRIQFGDQLVTID